MTPKFLAVGYAVGGIVVLALLLIVFIDPIHEGREFPPGQEKRVLPYHDARNRTLRDVAHRITVYKLMERMIIEKGQGGRWRLVEPVAARADQVAVEELLDVLTGLERVTSVTLPDTKSDTLNKYGLTPVTLKCVLSVGDETVSLVVGKDSRGRSRKEQRVYVRVGSSPLVEVVDVAAATALRRDPDTYRDRRVFHQGVVQARKVRIDGPNGKLSLEDVRDHWKTIEPREGRVDSDALVKLLKAMHELRVVTFPSSIGPGKTGLGHPILTCTLETWDNESTTLHAGGPVEGNLNRVYAMWANEATVFTLEWSDLRDIRVEPDSLCEDEAKRKADEQ